MMTAMRVKRVWRLIFSLRMKKEKMAAKAGEEHRMKRVLATEV